MGKFISLFAGVGGFDLGMEQAGHECVAQVEWDKNAAGVLKHRWPNVPLFCDVSKVSADDLPDADFITYGFPCQDLSVAGKEGLDGKRSGLFYEATDLLRELLGRGCGLRFAVAENVGGLFSADDGSHLQGASESYSTAGLVKRMVILDSQFLWPKDGSACSLSQILEVNPLTKYSLSPKACRGILRRAEKRGKELPEMLQKALERVALSQNQIVGTYPMGRIWVEV